MHHECIRKSITSPQFFALNRLFFKQSVGSLSLMVCSQLEMVSSTWLTFQEQIKLKYFVKYTNSYATTVRPNSLLFFELCLLSARTRAAGPQTKLLDPNNLVQPPHGHWTPPPAPCLPWCEKIRSGVALEVSTEGVLLLQHCRYTKAASLYHSAEQYHEWCVRVLLVVRMPQRRPIKLRLQCVLTINS